MIEGKNPCAVSQLEDCWDCFLDQNYKLLCEYDIEFEFNHSTGHMKQREDGCHTAGINLKIHEMKQ